MSEPSAGGPLVGPVEIVGTGLIGTSVGLALTRAGIEVVLRDIDQDHVRTASGLGAGRPVTDEDRPQLTVVAVPPRKLAETIAAALRRGGAVTDVGSVKSGLPTDPRYVGGHPMAGSERSGPLAATATLFEGRPWAITPHPDASTEVVALVADLVRLCGAVPVRLETGQHDLAVARTSHVPHLMAALAASALAEADPEHLTLSGQGVRDVTRVAAGDPALYGQIVSANAGPVSQVLTAVRDRLDAVLAALAGSDQAGLEAVLSLGVAGTAAIPGKHGGPVAEVGEVVVAVPDHPGELARLFADVGECGVNIEDVRIDHDPGRPVGLVELHIAPERIEFLHQALQSRGWVTHR